MQDRDRFDSRVCRTAVPRRATCQAGCLSRMQALCSSVQTFAAHESVLSARGHAHRRSPQNVLETMIADTRRTADSMHSHQGETAQRFSPSKDLNSCIGRSSVSTVD